MQPFEKCHTVYAEFCCSIFLGATYISSANMKHGWLGIWINPSEIWPWQPSVKEMTPKKKNALRFRLHHGLSPALYTSVETAPWGVRRDCIRCSSRFFIRGHWWLGTLLSDAAGCVLFKGLHRLHPTKKKNISNIKNAIVEHQQTFWPYHPYLIIPCTQSSLLYVNQVIQHKKWVLQKTPLTVSELWASRAKPRYNWSLIIY